MSSMSPYHFNGGHNWLLVDITVGGPASWILSEGLSVVVVGATSKLVGSGIALDQQLNSA